MNLQIYFSYTYLQKVLYLIEGYLAVWQNKCLLFYVYASEK